MAGKMRLDYLHEVLDSVICLCVKYNWDIKKITLVDLVIHLYVEKRYLEIILQVAATSDTDDYTTLHNTLDKLYKATQVAVIKNICLDIVNTCDNDDVSMCDAESVIDSESKLSNICVNLVIKLASEIGEYNYDKVRQVIL